MVSLINDVSVLRPRIDELVESAAAIPLPDVELLAPLPRPGKILCSTSGFGTVDAPPPQLMTLKSAESVIGPGGVVELPSVAAEWQFEPEAELGLVIRGPAKSVAAADWRTAVFGYTCVIDVMPRGDQQFGRDFWLAKSDTLGPVGPCIVTADEVSDPAQIRVQSWLDGVAMQDYAMLDADYSVADQVAFATTVMTLHTGDIIACGSPRASLREIRGGERLEVAIEPIGRLEVQVAASNSG